jgi:hypothetical protein
MFPDRDQKLVTVGFGGKSRRQALSEKAGAAGFPC